MLDKLGRLIEKRPWLVIGIILVITIGAGTLLPFLDMGTSTEDFNPDDEIVHANERMEEYFGSTGEMLWVYAKRQEADSVITPEALKEQYKFLLEINSLEKVKGSTSFVSFVELMCLLEYNKTLIDCTNEEITIVLQDLFYEKTFDETKMMDSDDPNEEIDYNPHPRLTKGKNIDSIDIKNYYIKENENTICFSIEVYDLSHFESKLSPPHDTMNVMEWFIDFNNLITPDEILNVNYKITAHIEPKNKLWQVGRGGRSNLKDMFDPIKNRELFNSYKKEAYLWVQMQGQDISFPIKLETGNVSFNVLENRIDIEVGKQELEMLGIAPEMYGSGLPARIGNTKAGFRFYQTPTFNLPWLRVEFDIKWLKQYFEKIENRPILSSITENLLNKIGNFTWKDFEKIFDMLEEQGFSYEKIALKDMDSWWVTLDESPDNGFGEKTFFIKSLFVDELKNKSLIFLSDEYTKNFKPSSALLLIFINESIGVMQSSDLSRYMVDFIQDFDSKENYVSMEVTGYGVISYQIDDLSNEANLIIIPGIFIAICVILFINFRRISYTILPLLGLSVSIIWLIGTMVLLGIRFNTIYVALVPLLLGLGVDYSVHLFHNYRSELDKGKSPGKAIINSINDVGIAMFLAALTTVIAFLSFLSASIPPLRDFGVLCALGIIYTFITTITLQASLRYVLDRRKKVAGKLKSKRKTNAIVMKKISQIVYKYSGVFLIIACIITVGMFIGATNVETGFDIEDFLPKDNPAMETLEEVKNNFPYSSQYQEYILIEGDVTSVDTLKGIHNSHNKLEDDSFVVRNPNGDLKVKSTLLIIQNAIRENSSIASEFNIDKNGIPKTDTDVKRLYDYLYNSNEYWIEIRNVLHKNDGSYDASVIRIYVDFSSSDESIAANQELLYNELNDDLSDYGDAKAIVTGGYSAAYTVTKGLTQSQIMSTAISIIIATIILIVVYRSPLLGLITIVPVAISIVWILGSIYFIGYSLNVMTVMVTSLTIGIGIDYAIHTTGRFRLVADKTGDPMKAMTETIGHTGSALLIAAMSTIAGFGILIFAPIPPEQQFGVIMCLTILYAFLTSIFILPTIIMKWAKWHKKRKGYIISPKKHKKD